MFASTPNLNPESPNKMTSSVVIEAHTLNTNLNNNFNFLRSRMTEIKNADLRLQNGIEQTRKKLLQNIEAPSQEIHVTRLGVPMTKIVQVQPNARNHLVLGQRSPINSPSSPTSPLLPDTQRSIQVVRHAAKCLSQSSYHPTRSISPASQISPNAQISYLECNECNKNREKIRGLEQQICRLNQTKIKESSQYLFEIKMISAERDSFKLRLSQSDRERLSEVGSLQRVLNQYKKRQSTALLSPKSDIYRDLGESTRDSFKGVHLQLADLREKYSSVVSKLKNKEQELAENLKMKVVQETKWKYFGVTNQQLKVNIQSLNNRIVELETRNHQISEQYNWTLKEFNSAENENKKLRLLRQKMQVDIEERDKQISDFHGIVKQLKKKNAQTAAEYHELTQRYQILQQKAKKLLQKTQASSQVSDILSLKQSQNQEQLIKREKQLQQKLYQLQCTVRQLSNLKQIQDCEKTIYQRKIKQSYEKIRQLNDENLRLKNFLKEQQSQESEVVYFNKQRLDYLLGESSSKQAQNQQKQVNEQPNSKMLSSYVTQQQPESIESQLQEIRLKRQILIKKAQIMASPEAQITGSSNKVETPRRGSNLNPKISLNFANEAQQTQTHQLSPHKSKNKFPRYSETGMQIESPQQQAPDDNLYAQQINHGSETKGKIWRKWSKDIELLFLRLQGLLEQCVRLRKDSQNQANGIQQQRNQLFQNLVQAEEYIDRLSQQTRRTVQQLRENEQLVCTLREENREKQEQLLRIRQADQLTSLNTEHLRRDRNALEAECSELRVRIADAQRRITQLKEENKQLVKQLEVSNTERIGSINIISQLQDQIRGISVERQNSEAKIRQLLTNQTQINNLISQLSITHHKDPKKSLQIHIQSLAHNLGTIKAEKQQLQVHLVNAENYIETMLAQRAVWETRIITEVQQNLTVRLQLQKQTQFVRIKDQVAQAAMQAQQSKTQVAKLMADVENKKGEAMRLAAQVEQANKQVNKLVFELEQAKREARELRVSADDANKQARLRAQQIENMKKEASQWAIQVNALRKQNQEISADVINKSRQMAEISQARDNAQKHITQLTTQITKIQLQLNKTRVETTHLTQHITHCQSQLLNLNHSLTTTLGQKHQLIGQLSQLSLDNTQLLNIKTQNQQKIAQLQCRLQEQVRISNQYMHEMERLNGDLQCRVREVRELKEGIQKQIGVIRGVTQGEGIRAEYQGQIRGIRGEYQGQIWGIRVEYQGQIREKDTVVQQLRQQVSRLKQVQQFIKQNHSINQLQINQLKQKYQSQLKTMTVQLSSRWSQVQSLSQQIQHLHHIHHAQIQQLITNYTNQLSTIRVQLNQQASVVISTLQNTVAEMQGQLSDKKQQISSLLSTISAMEASVAEFRLFQLQHGKKNNENLVIIDRYQQQESVIRAQLQALQAREQAFRAQCVSMQGQLSANEEAKRALTDEYNRSQQQNRVLKGEINKYQKQADALEKQIQLWKDQLDQIRLTLLQHSVHSEEMEKFSKLQQDYRRQIEQYVLEMEEKDKKIKEIEAKLSEKQAELQMMAYQKEQSQENLKLYQNYIKNKKKEKQQLINTRLQQLQTEIEKLRKKNAQLMAQKNDRERHIQQISIISEQAQNQMYRLQNQYMQKHQQQQQLLQAELDLLTETNNNLSQQLQKLKQQNQFRVSQLQSAHLKSLQQLQSQNTRLQTHLNSIKHTTDQLQSQLAILHHKHIQLHQNYPHVHTIHTDIQNQLDQAYHLHQRLQQLYNSIREEEVVLEGEIRVLVRSGELEREMVGLRGYVGELERELMEARHRWQLVQRGEGKQGKQSDRGNGGEQEQQPSKDDIAQLIHSTKVKSLQLQLQAKNHQLQQQVQKILLLESTIRQSEGDRRNSMQSSMQRVWTMERELAEVREKLEQREREIREEKETRDKDAKQMKQMMDKKNRQAKEIEEKRKGTEQQLKEKAQQCIKVQEENKKIMAHLLKAEAHIDCLQAQIRLMANERDQLSIRSTSQEATYQSQTVIKSLQLQVSNLQSQLHNLTLSYKNLDKQHSQCQSTITTLTSTLTTKQSTISTLQSQLLQTNTDLNSLHTTVASTQKILNLLQQQLVEVGKVNHQLQGELQQQRELSEYKQGQVRDREQEMEELKGRLAQAEKHIRYQEEYIMGMDGHMARLAETDTQCMLLRNRIEVLEKELEYFRNNQSRLVGFDENINKLSEQFMYLIEEEKKKIYQSFINEYPERKQTLVLNSEGQLMVITNNQAQLPMEQINSLNEKIEQVQQHAEKKIMQLTQNLKLENRSKNASHRGSLKGSLIVERDYQAAMLGQEQSARRKTTMGFRQSEEVRKMQQQLKIEKMYQQQIDLLKKKIEELTSQIQTMQQQTDEKVSALQDQNRQLKKQLQLTTATLDSQNNKYNKSQAEMTQLQQKYISQQQQLIRVNKQLSVLSEVSKKIHEGHDAIMEELGRMEEAKNELQRDYHRQIGNMRNDLSRLDEEKKRVEAQMVECSRQYERVKVQLDSLVGMLMELARQYKLVEEYKASVDTEEAGQNVKGIVRAIDGRLAQHHRISEENVKLKEKTVALQNKIREIEQSLAKSTSAASRLEKEIKESHGRVGSLSVNANQKNLTASYERIREELKQVNLQKSQLEKEKLSIQKEIQIMQARISEFLVKQANLIKENNTLEQKLGEAIRKLQQPSSEKHSIDLSGLSIDAESEVFKKQKSDRKSSGTTDKQRISLLQRLIYQYQQQVKSLEISVENLTHSLQSYQNKQIQWGQNQKLISSGIDYVTMISDRVQYGTEDQPIPQSELPWLNDLNRIIEHRLSRDKQQIEEKNRIIQELREEIQRIKSKNAVEMGSAKKESEVIEERYEELIADIVEAEARNKTLRTEVTTLNKQIERYKAQISQSKTSAANDDGLKLFLRNCLATIESIEANIEKIQQEAERNLQKILKIVNSYRQSSNASEVSIQPEQQVDRRKSMQLVRQFRDLLYSNSKQDTDKQGSPLMQKKIYKQSSPPIFEQQSPESGGSPGKIVEIPSPESIKDRNQLIAQIQELNQLVNMYHNEADRRRQKYSRSLRKYTAQMSKIREYFNLGIGSGQNRDKIVLVINQIVSKLEVEYQQLNQNQRLHTIEELQSYDEDTLGQQIIESNVRSRRSSSSPAKQGRKTENDINTDKKQKLYKLLDSIELDSVELVTLKNKVHSLKSKQQIHNIKYLQENSTIVDHMLEQLPRRPYNKPQILQLIACCFPPAQLHSIVQSGNTPLLLSSLPVPNADSTDSLPSNPQTILLPTPLLHQKLTRIRLRHYNLDNRVGLQLQQCLNRLYISSGNVEQFLIIVDKVFEVVAHMESGYLRVMEERASLLREHTEGMGKVLETGAQSWESSRRESSRGQSSQGQSPRKS